MVTTTPTPVDVAAARPPRKRRAGRGDDKAGYAFLAPWLIGFFVLTVGPMLVSLYLSFTDYDLYEASWIGLDNYRAMLSDPRFQASIRVTGGYVLFAVPIKLAAALAVAMLLNSPRRGLGFYRSALYAPSLVAASVSIAIIWRAMFIDDGIVDRVQQLVGIDSGGWIGNPSLSLPLFVLLAVWSFGGPMVIFLAGLKQVPAELYEAAEVDGAGPVRRFRTITLPMLSPVIFFNVLMDIIGSFQVFGSAFIISGGTGGPANSTLFYTLYLYIRGFSVGTDMGFASAMAWLLVVFVGILAVIFFRTSRYWVHYAVDEK